MAVIAFVLLVGAAVCFLVAAFNVSVRVNLIAVGLFLWVLTVVINAAGSLS